MPNDLADISHTSENRSTCCQPTGRLGTGGGILLVANYRPCNKTLALDAPAGPCEGRPVFPKPWRTTLFKIIFSQALASFQPPWVTPSPCDDEERDWSRLPITPCDCIYTIESWCGRYKRIWCTRDRGGSWKLYLVLWEHPFPFYGPPKGLLKTKLKIEKHPVTNKSFIKICIDRI